MLVLCPAGLGRLACWCCACDMDAPSTTSPLTLPLPACVQRTWSLFSLCRTFPHLATVNEIIADVVGGWQYASPLPWGRGPPGGYKWVLWLLRPRWSVIGASAHDVWALSFAGHYAGLVAVGVHIGRPAGGHHHVMTGPAPAFKCDDAQSTLPTNLGVAFVPSSCLPTGCRSCSIFPTCA